MKLRQMEVFHAIMSAGTVTGAAKLLNISQPAVSTVLHHTEDQLRIKLFQRVKGRLRPTPEAQILFKEIDRIFESTRTVRRLATDLRETKRGILNIVTTPSLGAVVVPSAVSSFLDERKQIRIQLQVRPRTSTIELVASGGAEIGFSFLSVDHPSIQVELVTRGKLVCIADRSHPLAQCDVVSPKDIAQHTMIAYSHSQGLNPMIDAAFMEQRVAQPGVIEASTVLTAWALVSRGIGVAVVDSFSELETLYPNVVMRPFTPCKDVNLELLFPEGKELSLIAQSFVRHLKDRILRHQTLQEACLLS